jgi:uncharacterized membrane protein YfcA
MKVKMKMTKMKASAAWRHRKRKRRRWRNQRKMAAGGSGVMAKLAKIIISCHGENESETSAK